ncbi:PocR ligand-binding domain-containing protein [Spirochaetota bacterium]
MKLPLQILLKPEVQDIFNNFSASFNIMLVYYSPTEDILQLGVQKKPCHFCSLVRWREDLGLLKNCLKTDHERMSEAHQKGRFILYQCHAGLTEGIKPIYKSDELIGYIMIAQFRTPKNRIAPYIIEAWKKKFGDNKKLFEAYDEIPCVPKEKLDSVIGLFLNIVDYIESKHLVSLKQYNPLEMILDHMDNNIEKTISLHDAARLVGKSTSTVDYMFRNVLGRTFKQMLLEKKFDRAEQLMRERKTSTIKEIALAVGFSDSLYFSRIYKKYRGIPPSKYLSSHIDNIN